MKERLKHNVLLQLGMDPDDITDEDRGTLEDIVNHGIDGGFCGFIYYTDTLAFFDDNRADILDLAREYAEDFGQTISELISGFNCVDCSPSEVESFLLGLSDEDETYLKNALAWFAGEEVAREMTQ